MRACPDPGSPDGSSADLERLADGLAARTRRTASRHARATCCGEHPERLVRVDAACPGRAIGTSPSNGRPGRVREQVADGRAGRAGRLVEVDDPFLRGDERRERGDRLRDRRESHRARRVAAASDAAVRDRRHRRRRTRPASRRSGEAPARGGDTSRAMERRLIAGTGAYEPIVGYSRAVVAGDRVHVSGTAAEPARRLAAAGGHLRPDAPLPRAHRHGPRARGLEPGARRAHTRLPHRRGRLRRLRARARARSSAASDPRTRPSSPGSSTLAGRSRSRSRPFFRDREASLPVLDHRQRRGARGERSRPQFGAGDPTPSVSRRSTSSSIRRRSTSSSTSRRCSPR